MQNMRDLPHQKNNKLFTLPLDGVSKGVACPLYIVELFRLLDHLSQILMGSLQSQDNQFPTYPTFNSIKFCLSGFVLKVMPLMQSHNLKLETVQREINEEERKFSFNYCMNTCGRLTIYDNVLCIINLHISLDDIGLDVVMCKLMKTLRL